MCVHESMCPWSPEEGSDPQELKLQVVVIGVLGNEFRFSSREVHAFNHWAISAPPFLLK